MLAGRGEGSEAIGDALAGGCDDRVEVVADMGCGEVR